MSLKAEITEAMKDAMRAKDKPRLTTIRLITSAIKQTEVDNQRDDTSDEEVLAIVEKMIKQRRQSIVEFEKAGRDDLIEQEVYEIGIIEEWMPEQLSEEEVAAIIDSAITESGAESMRDMGKVMGIAKAKLQGRADMAAVSGLIKAKLA